MQSQISPIQNLLALKFRHQSGLIQHRVENAGFQHQNSALGCGVNVDRTSVLSRLHGMNMKFGPVIAMGVDCTCVTFHVDIYRLFTIT